MASDTALNLVNRILRMTGDYTPLTTVVGSPANIAERYIDSLNITIDDARNHIDFEELRYDFVGTADGTNSVWDTSGANVEPSAAMTVTVDNNVLEEVSWKRMQDMRATNYITGQPAYFSRLSTATGNLSVDIYPTPANGATITIISSIRPTYFTVNDTDTTEINDNTLLVLGAIAHADAYAGMERGYMQLYMRHIADRWVNRNRNLNIRIIPEDYR